MKALWYRKYSKTSFADAGERKYVQHAARAINNLPCTELCSCSASDDCCNTITSYDGVDEASIFSSLYLLNSVERRIPLDQCNCQCHLNMVYTHLPVYLITLKYVVRCLALQ